MSQQMKGPCFLYCRNCSGHGHFVIPGYGEQFEVFSRSEARQQLHLLYRKRRVALDQFHVLKNQVQQSWLPESCPVDVKAFIRQCYETEAWAIRFSRPEEKEPQEIETNIAVDSDELAWLVHEYYLVSSARLYLQ